MLVVVLSLVFDASRHFKYLKHLGQCVDKDDELGYIQLRTTVVWVLEASLLVIAANYLLILIDKVLK